MGAPSRSEAAVERYRQDSQQGFLRLPRCSNCGQIFHPRSMLCPACMSFEFELVPAAGRGRIYSFTVLNNYPLSPDFAPEMPYCLGFVELNEGPYLFTRILSDDPDDIAIGVPVELTFRALGGSHDEVPCFKTLSARRDPSDPRDSKERS